MTAPRGAPCIAQAAAADADVGEARGRAARARCVGERSQRLDDRRAAVAVGADAPGEVLADEPAAARA